MKVIRTQLRLPVAVHQRLVQSAKRNERSMNGEIVRMLTDVIEREREEVKDKTA